MSKSFRFAVILFVLAISALFLRHSVNYYFLLDPEARNYVENKSKIAFEQEKDELPIELVRDIEDAFDLKKEIVPMGLDIKGGIHVVIEADFSKVTNEEGDELDAFKAEAMRKLIIKITERINPTGLTEASIRKLGDERVVAEIPGKKNIEDFKDLIEKVGLLEFKIVNSELNEQVVDRQTGQIVAPELVDEESGSYIYTNVVKNDGKVIGTNFMVLYTNLAMAGKHIKDTSAQIIDGRYGVAFTLDGEGREIFGKVTSANVKEQLAIILDGYVMSAPTIQTPIIGGRGNITGAFSQMEAESLALILKSGALPITVNIISKDVIGPKLGQEFLQKGIKALILGVCLVIAFMILYYRLAGLISSVALILNGLIIFAILIPLNLTLTLPGIAGLILTMGMAIDANVIIFERIREELFLEKRFIFDAISVGYQKAFWTIWDANVTTLIAAFILAYWGTGPIQGFANTLFIGILVSLFTSLFFTRYVFDLLIDRNVIKQYNKLIV